MDKSIEKIIEVLDEQSKRKDKYIFIMVIIMATLCCFYIGSLTYTFNQYDYVEEISYEVESEDGGNSIVNGSGEVEVNGSSESN